jgi:hypothetical protein
MLPAVEFDGEAKAWAIKIKRKRPDRMLPSELKAIELAATKRAPKQGFRIRHVTAELPRTRGHRLCS